MKTIRISDRPMRSVLPSSPLPFEAEVYPKRGKPVRYVGSFQHVVAQINKSYGFEHPAIVFGLFKDKPPDQRYTIYFIGLDSLRIEMRNQFGSERPNKKHAVTVRNPRDQGRDVVYILEEYRRMPKKVLQWWYDTNKELDDMKNNRAR